MKTFRFRTLVGATFAVFLSAGFPAMAQTVAGTYEFSNCTVPERLSFVAEDLNAPWWPYNFQAMRYVKFPGQAQTKMMPAPGKTTAKNPEGATTHGPGQIQNCTPGSGYTQWLAFRVRTQYFFSSVVGNHLAFMLRANFPTMNQVGNEKYDWMGVIFFQWRNESNQVVSQGVAGERFSYPSPTSHYQAAPASNNLTLQDNTTYLVEAQAAPTHIAYRVTNETNGTTTGWVNYTPPEYSPDGRKYGLAGGTGLAFAVLCNDANGSCANYNGWYIPYRVDLWDIASGWM